MAGGESVFFAFGSFGALVASCLMVAAVATPAWFEVHSGATHQRVGLFQVCNTTGGPVPVERCVAVPAVAAVVTMAKAANMTGSGGGNSGRSSLSECSQSAEVFALRQGWSAAMGLLGVLCLLVSSAALGIGWWWSGGGCGGRGHDDGRGRSYQSSRSFSSSSTPPLALAIAFGTALAGTILMLICVAIVTHTYGQWYYCGTDYCSFVFANMGVSDCAFFHGYSLLYAVIALVSAAAVIAVVVAHYWHWRRLGRYMGNNKFGVDRNRSGSADFELYRTVYDRTSDRRRSASPSVKALSHRQLSSERQGHEETGEREAELVRRSGTPQGLQRGVGKAGLLAPEPSPARRNTRPPTDDDYGRLLDGTLGSVRGTNTPAGGRSPFRDNLGSLAHGHLTQGGYPYINEPFTPDRDPQGAEALSNIRSPSEASTRTGPRSPIRSAMRSESAPLHHSRDRSRSASRRSRSVATSAATTATTAGGQQWPADWVFHPQSRLYWSHSQELYLDPTTEQYYDPHSGQWYDPKRNVWYIKEEDTGRPPLGVPTSTRGK